MHLQGLWPSATAPAPDQPEPEAASNSTCPLIVLAPILEAAFEEATALGAVIVESIAPALVTAAAGLSEPAFEEAVALSAELVANASFVLAEGLMEAVADVYPECEGEDLSTISEYLVLAGFGTDVLVPATELEVEPPAQTAG
eukprot:jgi/Astpho2/8728/Aster-05292